MKTNPIRHHTILIVDDEPSIRSKLSHLFQREGFDSLLAKNSEDGLILLKKRPVSVVFSDYIMPGQSGLAFLRDVQQRYPKISRVFLSGLANISVMTNAINEGVISSFLLKPWDNEILIKTLYQAVERFEQKLPSHQRLKQRDCGSAADDEILIATPGISAVRESNINTITTKR